MFKQSDADYDEMMVDPIRRRARIASLTKRRPFLFCCIMVIVACAVIDMWTGEKGAMTGVFGTAIFWGFYIKLESDLRLLRVIDLLQKGKDEQPSA